MYDRLLIRNVTFCPGEKAGDKFDILIENGTISGIVSSGSIQYEGKEISAGGLIAIPGLIDLHIHGAGGSDSLDGTKEAFSNISRALARLGTTGFLSAMVIRPGQKNHHLATACSCTGKDLGGAELLGIYIEGPFINISKRGGIVPESITGPSPLILENILNESADALRIMCLAPEIPGNENIIKRLNENGVIAAFGHSDADYEEARRGFDSGISHVTHLFNAMRPLHHRNPGPLAAVFENSSVSFELISDGHHLHPALIRMVRRLANPGNIVCITDGISGMGLPDGIYTYNNREYRSEEGLARYLDGTLIGSTMSLSHIIKNFMDFTGAGFRESIETVTLNPARILKIDNRKGSLEKGKDADIVLIDKMFDIRYTIIGGKTVYNR